MKVNAFVIVIALFVSTSSIASKIDTVGQRSLLVKTEILLPILTIVQDEGIILSLSAEYKTKSKISYQLTGYITQNDNEYSNYKSYIILPEARYYLKNHFVGLYMKYHNNYTDNSGRITKSNVFGTGVLYGYQIEFGRYNVEGYINTGIKKKYYTQGTNGDHEKEDDPIFDILFGIRLGWKIF